MIKHEEVTPIAGSQTQTIDPGIYYFDTWNNSIYFKKLSNNDTVPTSSTFLGIPEISGIRNPYII